MPSNASARMKTSGVRFEAARWQERLARQSAISTSGTSRKRKPKTNPFFLTTKPAALRINVFDPVRLSEEEIQLFETYAGQCSGFRYIDLCKRAYDLEEIQEYAKTFLSMVGHCCPTPQELFRNLLTALVIAEHRGVTSPRIVFNTSTETLENYSAAIVVWLLSCLYHSYGFQSKFQSWLAVPAYREAIEFAREVVDYLIDHLSTPTLEVSEYYTKQVERLLKL